jgi:hypothetical protein
MDQAASHEQVRVHISSQDDMIHMLLLEDGVIGTFNLVVPRNKALWQCLGRQRNKSHNRLASAGQG